MKVSSGEINDRIQKSKTWNLSVQLGLSSFRRDFLGTDSFVSVVESAMGVKGVRNSGPHPLTRDAWYYDDKKGFVIIYELRLENGVYLRTVQFTIPWKQVLKSVDNIIRLRASLYKSGKKKGKK